MYITGSCYKIATQNLVNFCIFSRDGVSPCWSGCVPVPRVIAVGIGVDIGIPAVRLDFLQEVTAVPNKSGFLFEVV